MTLLILAYLAAIVAANLLVALFGAPAAIINALVLVSIDLSTRDILHETWEDDHLRRNMARLVLGGSVLSALTGAAFSWLFSVPIPILPIAAASFVAFALAGLADTLVYAALGRYGRLVRMNGSNVVSALVDSAAFVLLAFVAWADKPLPLDVAGGIVAAQFVAKVGGGALWSLALDWWQKRKGAGA